MDPVSAVLRQVSARQPATLDRLITLLRFPTVSADPRHATDLAACADWLARLLARIGLHDVEVWPGHRAPMVTAAWLGRPGRPTVLVYGHYDVQPVTPRSAWVTDPFRPVRRGPYLHARGASDDKGQLMAHLAAIEAWLASTGALPVNLRVILDGEEEIGSPTLLAAVARGWPPLAADVAVVSDTWMLSPRRPVLISGLRGMLATRLEIGGPSRDLHAGTFGGAVANPAEALARLVASLHDKTGRIQVAGFHDDARAMTEAERRHLAHVGPSDASLLAPAAHAQPHLAAADSDSLTSVGLARPGLAVAGHGLPMAGYGEPGYSAFERATRRPALVVTDLRTSGGGRTVLPAQAAADLNVRLVADQDPARVAAALYRHLRSRLPPGVRGRLVIRGCCPPYTLDQRAPVLPAVQAACRSAFGRDPVLLPSGGSIPFVSSLAAAQRIDVALLGFGLPGDAIHAPNERFYLPSLARGTRACAELYSGLAGIQPRM
jgi:acetylornithine deacetylase/succinyl-diaminopimelate desuccinylase-like protein